MRGRTWLVLACSMLLSACGGGGGNDGGNNPPPSAMPGSVQWNVDALSVDENAQTAQLTVTRTGGSDGAITVAIATGDGSATAGQDYIALTSTVSFAAGDAVAKTVTVSLTDDNGTEADETLTVTLSAPTGGA